MTTKAYVILRIGDYNKTDPPRFMALYKSKKAAKEFVKRYGKEHHIILKGHMWHVPSYD